MIKHRALKNMVHPHDAEFTLDVLMDSSTFGRLTGYCVESETRYMEFKNKRAALDWLAKEDVSWCPISTDLVSGVKEKHHD